MSDIRHDSNSPETHIRAVVFDLDGLMFNTEDVFNAAGEELLNRRGHVLTSELLRRMMGRRVEESFAIMIDTLQLKEDVPTLLAESQEIFDGLLDQLLAPMPGLFGLLSRIEKATLPMGVATSSSRPYLEDILGRFQLRERFHVTLTAEDVTHGKPHPEIYFKAAKSLGIHTTEMLVLEDSEAGTRAAAAADALVVSIPTEHSRGHDFSGAHYVAKSLVDPYLLGLISPSDD